MTSTTVSDDRSFKEFMDDELPGFLHEMRVTLDWLMSEVFRNYKRKYPPVSEDRDTSSSS